MPFVDRKPTERQLVSYHKIEGRMTSESAIESALEADAPAEAMTPMPKMLDWNQWQSKLVELLAKHDANGRHSIEEERCKSDPQRR